MSARLIGIDTNVLVRLLTADHGGQTAIANRIVAEAAPVFVSLIVLTETAWVLRSIYRLPLDMLLGAFEALLANANFEIEEEGIVHAAIAASGRMDLDVADCLIALRNQQLGCATTVTFDRRAARLPAFRLLTDAGDAGA